MRKVIVEVDYEQVDSIVRQDLNALLGYLRNDLERVKEHQRGYVFEHDWEMDTKEIKKHIKSFERVLRYYGEPL